MFVEKVKPASPKTRRGDIIYFTPTGFLLQSNTFLQTYHPYGILVASETSDVSRIKCRCLLQSPPPVDKQTSDVWEIVNS
jgi:hypothetical protein